MTAANRRHRRDGFIGRNLRVRLRRSTGYADVVGVTRATTPERPCVRARRGGRRLPPGRRQPAADTDEFAAGNTWFTETLCAIAGGAERRAPLAYRVVHPGGARQSVRPQQARGRADASRTTATKRRVADLRLPADQRLRQVVPAELQLGGRDLLPQHRPRPADRPFTTRSAPLSLAVHRRRGRIPDRPAWQGCTSPPAFIDVGPIYQH